ncbi:nicotinate-nucleotide--dimethylbenzimidazole phosphoribosyltransferase [Marinimicrobium locisalis]|uniref:nicotinate-nucleotide--dimethylbenzimidazole phosphoribosyltransferase n=1 Tax=Marinimicrobium locisalis TaxID=546022 RepID=UPI003221C3AE
MSTQSRWLHESVAPLSEAARQGARERQKNLTKPPGSLGHLEWLAERFAGWQNLDKPAVDRVQVCVFAADHGVAAQGVSAYPQAVTAQMIANFCAGGAAVSVLAQTCGAELQVINLGCVAEAPAHAQLRDRIQGPGTADFTQGPAMTEAQLHGALAAGREAVSRTDLFIGGEMGIGNTTAASALQAALLDVPAAAVVGPGTGVDSSTLARKSELIARALKLHAAAQPDPLELLRCLGGFEIAGLTGAYIAAAQQGVPSLVDGYISTVAALLAVRLNPGVRDWLLFAHESAEPGHRRMLAALNARPLVSLDLRLGEGSGAALVVPLVRNALALHSRMATFEEAGVSSA